MDYENYLKIKKKVFKVPNYNQQTEIIFKNNLLYISREEKIIDLDTEKEYKFQPFGKINNVLFSPDKKYLAYIDIINKLTFWNFSENTFYHSIRNKIESFIFISNTEICYLSKNNIVFFNFLQNREVEFFTREFNVKLIGIINNFKDLIFTENDKILKLNIENREIKIIYEKHFSEIFTFESLNYIGILDNEKIYLISNDKIISEHCYDKIEFITNNIFCGIKNGIIEFFNVKKNKIICDLNIFYCKSYKKKLNYNKDKNILYYQLGSFIHFLSLDFLENRKTNLTIFFCGLNSNNLNESVLENFSQNYIYDQNVLKLIDDFIPYM